MNLKLALLREASDAQPEDHHGRNLAMVAAGAAPFAGLIGQESAIHEGAGPRVNYKKLRGLIQPGDVLITGGKDLSMAKGLVGAVTGRPYGYHAAVAVNGGKTVVESHPATGFSGDKIWRDQRVQVLRPKLSPVAQASFAKRLQEHSAAADAIQAATAKRLVRAGHDAAGAKDWAGVARSGMYDEASGPMLGIKELFMPKLHSDVAIEADRAKAVAGHAQFRRSVGDPGISRAARDVIQNSPEGVTLKGKNFQHLFPGCTGDVCSTVPAKFLPKGFQVVPGKLPSEILASDYLRSRNFESVARYDPYRKAQLHDVMLKHAPTMARLAVGAGLAGAVYGGSKLLERFRNRESKSPTPARPPRQLA